MIRESAIVFAVVDVVPHLAAKQRHQRSGEFSVISEKGLFQHNLPIKDITPLHASVQDLPAPAALAKPAICLPCQSSEQNIRNKCKDVLAVWLLLARLASTHRVTSPFPGSLHPKIHHIHRPPDFRDVYAGIGLDSRPYDAISDVFLALQPVPPELHALRLHLACSGRLF